MLIFVEGGCLEEIWERSRVHLGKKEECLHPNMKDSKAAKPKEERKKQQEKKGGEWANKKLKRTKSSR